MATQELVGHSLAENEEVIRRGLSTFVEVGNALMEIRDHRQYIEAGFDTFEEFCRDRLDLSRDYAGNQIAAANVVAIATSIGTEVPTKEWVARPLVKILNQDGEEAVRNAWSQIVEAHELEGAITGKEVRRFLTTGGATYGKPGWHELLGQVGDTLLKARKELEKFTSAIGERKPAEALREKAAEYAEWAEDLAIALHEIEGDEELQKYLATLSARADRA